MQMSKGQFDQLEENDIEVFLEEELWLERWDASVVRPIGDTITCHSTSEWHGC